MAKVTHQTQQLPTGCCSASRLGELRESQCIIRRLVLAVVHLAVLIGLYSGIGF